MAHHRAVRALLMMIAFDKDMQTCETGEICLSSFLDGEKCHLLIKEKFRLGAVPYKNSGG